MTRVRQWQTRLGGLVAKREAPATLVDVRRAEVAGGGGGTVGIGDVTGLNAALNGKQDTLVSGSTIKTVNGSSVLGSGNLVVTGEQSFETVAKNLVGSNAVPGYSGGELVTLTYANGIVKTFGYSGGRLVTVTLSGALPGGIQTVKTLTYTGDDVTGISYS